MGNTNTAETLVCKRCNCTFTNNTCNKDSTFYEYCQRCTILEIISNKNKNIRQSPIDKNKKKNNNKLMELPNDLS